MVCFTCGQEPHKLGCPAGTEAEAERRARWRKWEDGRQKALQGEQPADTDPSYMLGYASGIQSNREQEQFQASLLARRRGSKPAQP